MAARWRAHMGDSAGNNDAPGRGGEKRQFLQESAAELQRRDEEEGSDDAAEHATDIRELQRRHSFNWMT